MKKSTGIILLLTFFFLMMVIAGIIVTVLVLTIQGTPPSIFSSNRIALVRVEGLIYDAEEWIDQVETYAEDDSIHAIVLRVDSPGGAVGPSQDLYEAIHDARHKHGKVVVASFGSLAASGGYYVAAAANEIICSEGTLTGSIGVYAKFLKTEKLFEMIGIDYETVKAGEFKDMGSMEKGLTEKERELMQHVIDDTYMQFIEVVKQGRQHAFTQLLNNWKPDGSESYYPFTPVLRSLCRQNQEEKSAFDEQQTKLRKEFDLQNKPENNVEKPDDESGEPDAASSATDASEEVNADDASNEDEDTVEPDHEPSRFQPKEFRPKQETLMAFARETAEGKIYTGRQAREVGLVDGFGSLDDAINRAKTLVNLTGDVTLVERKEREPNLFDLLSQKLSMMSEAKTQSPLEYKFPY